MKEIDSNLNTSKKFNLKSKEAKYYHNEVSEILRGLTYKEKFNIVKEVDKNLLKKVNTFTGKKGIESKRRSFIEIKNYVYVMGCKRLFC